MKLIDSHTHLSSEDFDSDRADVLNRAFQVCDYLIDIGSGTSPDAFRKARALAEANENVFFTVGVHPHDAAVLGKDQNLLKEIESAAAHSKCVAVGECGLDYYYDHSDRESQKEV